MEPLTVTLAGTGIAGHLVASPPTLAFGRVDLNTSATLTLQLSNAGQAPLTGLSAALSGPNAASFAVLTPCTTASLAPAAHCTLQVAFAPTQPGEQQAQLILQSSDPSTPLLIPLTGTGAQPPGYRFTVNGAGTATASIATGSQASFALAAVAQGGFAAPLALTCTALVAAPNTTCTLSAPQMPMTSGTAQATVTLTTQSGLPPAHRLTKTAALSWLGSLASLALSVAVLRRRRSDRLPALLLLVACLLSGATILGCGDGSVGQRLPYTPPGIYRYQVTATPPEGTLAPASVTLTLIVQ